MRTLILILSILVTLPSNAQLKSIEDNSQYAIAQKIADKAKQRNLGAIHSESPKMRPTAGKGGWFLRYEHGWVYYNPKLNKAFAIMENMMKKWGEVGYETGWMGFPISDNLETPKVYGFYTAFENGSIYSSAKNGTHFIGGAFRDEWAKRGYENSQDLGFPKTDEVAINVNGYTRYQQFERGTLFFGNGKPILYSNNPNATTPPKDESMELAFIPKEMTGFEPTIDVNEGSSIELYGWMDLRVYRGNGQEISDADGKSFSLFNIQKKQPVEINDYTPYFFKENTASRHYNITQSDIDGNAYIRITYWLNDYDKYSSDDYLKLENYNGRWNYNGGDHPYREIKLKEIIRNGKIKNFMDKGSDGTDYIKIFYDFTVKNN